MRCKGMKSLSLHAVLVASLLAVPAATAEPTPTSNPDSPTAAEAPVSLAPRAWSRLDERHLRAVIARAPMHGLRAAPFQALLPAPTARGEERDRALTVAFTAWARAMLDGATDPEAVDHLIVAHPPTDLSPWLTRLDEGEPMGDLLEDLLPDDPEYVRLQEELEVLRGSARTGWTPIPDSDSLDPEEPASAVAVRTLRRRLIEESFIARTCARPPVGPPTPAEVEVPACLIDGLKAFQDARGLEVDGVLGANTRAELNITPEDRIAQVEANLERLRWRPEVLAERRIDVNIAAFELAVHRPGEDVRRIAVIAGTPTNSTPLFADAIERVVLNPYWNVPASIAVGEIVPKVADDPAGGLARRNMQVLKDGKVVDPSSVDWSAAGRGDFPYRIRQRPGTSNALGNIKFLFPNRFSVYLHDTPKDHLFEEEDRTFSHGCVRVGEPLVLGGLVLEAQGWSAERIAAAIEAGDQERIELEEPLPVELYYHTVFVRDGRVHYEQDPYGIDADVIENLAGPLPVANQDKAIAEIEAVRQSPSAG